MDAIKDKMKSSTKLLLYILNSCIMVFVSQHNTYGQNSGVGVVNPTHTFHVKPSAANPNQDPIRIENFQPYLAQSDSMVVVVDPATGVLRVISLYEIFERSRDSGLQNAQETELTDIYDLDGNGLPELNVQDALEALYNRLPKGTFKTIGEARAAGLVDGDSFIAHPESVLGCPGCTIKLHPGMN